MPPHRQLVTASPVELTVHHAGDTIVVRLAGELHARHTPTLPARLERLVEEAAGHQLVIDLEQLYLPDTASVAALAAVLQAANLTAHGVRLAGSRPATREAIHRTGLDQHQPPLLAVGAHPVNPAASTPAGAQPWPA
ncbi:MAG: STAS domain-containing protein [Actinomycetes bacterium]|jgi:anti-anti-sigma factor